MDEAGEPSPDQEKDYAIGEAQRWKTEIELYEREAEKSFTERGKKIIKRYKDERSKGEEDRRNKFNILWSNVQTLSPAIFAKNPTVNVERRYQSDDDLGRFASEVLERATSFFVQDKFFDCIKEVVLDRLLPGRGTAWIRYVPEFAPESDIEDEQDKLPEVTEDANQPELLSEDVICDYVHWQDFGHTYARTWEEVTGVWRKVYMSRKKLVKRFPECGAKIPLDHAPEKLNDEKLPTEVKKATIYEIWDKDNKKAIWIHKDYPEPLDEIDDPLKLEDFFPCPRPLFATLANDSIIPVPDYAEYQDQAEEIDDLTARIHLLTKAVKVAGVYAGDVSGIERLLSEGLENMIIPIDNWAMFAEKGGLKGVIDYLPLKDIVAALTALYEAREKAKQDLYEISGISDILRGQGDPNETATGVKTKGQFGTLRLTDMQSEVARFSRDMVRLIAQIICNLFSDETIKEISGVQLLTKQEKMQVQTSMQQQAMQAPAQPQGQQQPQPPPAVPEKLAEALQNPAWEEVLALLKNKAMRKFRIDIEIDSTIKMDQDKERQDRVDFLEAAGGFIREAAAVQQPELQPLLMRMLMFGVRGFHVAKDLESAFEVAIAKAEKEAQNPTQKPDPEMVKTQGMLALEKMKIEGQQQADAADIKVEQAKAQKDVELEQARMQADQQVEAMKANHQREVDGHKQAHEMVKLQLSHAQEMQKIQSTQKIAGAKVAAQTPPEPKPDPRIDQIQAKQDKMGEDIGAALKKQQDTMEEQIKLLLNLVKEIAKPKGKAKNDD